MEDVVNGSSQELFLRPGDGSEPPVELQYSSRSVGYKSQARMPASWHALARTCQAPGQACRALQAP